MSRATRSRRPNTSRYAILGVLSLCPMSGYDVKKLIERSIAHFWNESYGQIYPSLNRLAAEGLAARRRETQRGKPDRYIYSLTAKGRRELEHWLATPARLEPVRSELLLKLFLGGAAPVADSLAQLDRYEARQRELLETYLGIERRLNTEMADHPQLPFALVTLRHGQHRCRAMLQWCAEASLPRDAPVVRGGIARPEAAEDATGPPAALRRKLWTP